MVLPQLAQRVVELRLLALVVADTTAASPDGARLPSKSDRAAGRSRHGARPIRSWLIARSTPIARLGSC
jgi:hypothetical protein